MLDVKLPQRFFLESNSKLVIFFETKTNTNVRQNPNLSRQTNTNIRRSVKGVLHGQQVNILVLPLVQHVKKNITYQKNYILI